MTPIPVLLKWAKATLTDLGAKKLKIEDKKVSKTDAYLRMIIDRGEIMVKEMARMQKFTEDIEDGLKKLESYGVPVPVERKNENPLKN